MINPQDLTQILDYKNIGYALDVHVTKSIRTENKAFENEYSDAARYLKKIKYEKETRYIPDLAQVLAVFWQGKYPNQGVFLPEPSNFDYILCVPPSDLNRKFQPVYEIGKKISEYTQVPLLPEGVFVKVKDTPTTKTQAEDEAKKLLKGAFSIVHPEKLQEKNILIFDDIVRNGTTLKEIITTLRKEAEVSEIFVLTVTKTKTKTGLSNLPF